MKPELNKASVVLLRTGYALGEQLLVRATPILLSILLARALSVSEFANFSYLRLTVDLFASYAALGLTTAAARSAATFDDRPDEARHEILISWSLSATAAAMGALAILFAAGSLAENSLPGWWYAALVPVIVIGIVPLGVLLGREEFGWAFVFTALSTATAILIGFWAYFEASVGLAVLSLAVFQGGRSFGAITLMLRRLGRLSFPPRGAPLRAAVSYAFRFAGSMSLVSIMAASGPWLLGRILLEQGGDRAFALFAIGLQWFGIAVFIPGLASRVLFAGLVRQRTKGTFELKRFYKLLTAFLAVAMASALMGWILQDVLIGLYGDNYHDAGWIIPAFMAAGACVATINLVGNVVVAKGQTYAWLCISAAWLALLLSLFVLFPDGRVESAALALGLAGLGQLLLTLVFLHRESRHA